MTRIVFLDRDTLSPETTLREPEFTHNLVLYRRSTPEEVAGRIADADIVITNKAPIRADAIAGAPRLKLIAVAATGTDCVDLSACRKAGITVCNIRDYATNTVPEHTFALMLALRRSILPYRQSVIDGRWQEARQFCFFDHPISDLSGSTLGIVGHGALGRSVARIAEAFGMTVLVADRKGAGVPPTGRTAFDEVMRRSDVITLHCPLNAETRGIIAAREFALMERKPILINTGRGGLVDEQALVDALDAEQISGAGFDVTDGEPPALDSPMMRIAGRPNVILTPHVAWASWQAIQALADQLVENIELFQRGTPRNVVG
ncbi:D-2-hydroxyacid dehydrogenase [Ciceribacter azotifigens]|uniref:D-2-hydroxyacid dehydrogenase n=1 Tax=Ciceribacter azotifigens TaxID=2069303 RepID=UPI003A84AE70